MIEITALTIHRHTKTCESFLIYEKKQHKKKEHESKMKP